MSTRGSLATSAVFKMATAFANPSHFACSRTLSAFHVPARPASSRLVPTRWLYKERELLLRAAARRSDAHRTSSRRKPSAHLVAEDHLIRKSSQVVGGHIQTASPSQVGQPRPRVVLSGGLSVIWKHDGQHVAGQALQSFVPRDVKRTPPNGSHR